MQQQVPQLRFATMRLASGPRVHDAEQGDPSGEPIVFLPAYTDSWFSYSRVLPLLPPRYHAYALDQRGHGGSDRPDCCYAVEDFAGDVVAFLDAVGSGGQPWWATRGAAWSPGAWPRSTPSMSPDSC